MEIKKMSALLIASLLFAGCSSGSSVKTVSKMNCSMSDEDGTGEQYLFGIDGEQEIVNGTVTITMPYSLYGAAIESSKDAEKLGLESIVAKGAGLDASEISAKYTDTEMTFTYSLSSSNALRDALSLSEDDSLKEDAVKEKLESRGFQCD